MNYNYEILKDMSALELFDYFMEFINYKEKRSALIRCINASPIDYKKIYSLLPILDEDDISFMLKYDKDYPVSFLLSLVNIANEDDLTKQAIFLFNRYNINYIIPLLPYVDETIIQEEYIKSFNKKKST